MTTFNIQNALHATFLLLTLGLSGCLGGESGGSSSTTPPSTTSASAKPTVNLVLTTALPATDSNTTNTVSFGNSIYAVATLKDASGVPVANSVVTFSSASSLIVFNPATATALTDAKGIASVKLDSASISSAGAASLSVSADVVTTTADTSTTQTITSPPIGVAVNGAAVTLGTLTLGQPSISAYGTSIVSVPVLINGIAAASPISVAFTSPCVVSGKASLTSPVTSVAGAATSTYKDDNCNSGMDTITASVTGASSNATISVAAPAANNMQFVSAMPTIIGIQGAGSALAQSALIKFKVVDNANNGKAGVLVDFSLLPSSAPGGITVSPSSATSDSNGEVTTSVISGTVPTPVSVVAKVHTNSAILSQSNTLTITTGLPAQDFFSISVQSRNIEAWEYDGVTSAITIIASDRLGNAVPDGTTINFISEGGQILPASCNTTNGTCTVTFKSSEYRPRGETTSTHPNGAVAAVDAYGSPILDAYGLPIYVTDGRVTILAYAVGEKSFIDANGNNVYDAGETFYDLGDLYIDSNENGTWDSSATQPNLHEQSINFSPVVAPVACLTRNVNGGTAALPINYSNVPSKDNSCDGAWGKNYVRRSHVIVLSSSFPRLSQYSFSMNGSCLVNFTFWLMDKNNNPMPVGTTLSMGTFVSSNGSSPTLTIAGTPVIDTSHAGGTLVGLSVDGGSTCSGPGTTPVGNVSMDVKTPQGMTTTIPLAIN